MRRWVSIAAVLSLCAVAAIAASCGGDPAPAGTCTYSLTGAQTGSYQCKVMVIASPELTTLVVVPTSQGGIVQGVAAEWVFAGVHFEPATYNTGNVQQADVFVAGGTSVWDMAHGRAQQDHPDQGDFVLNVTSAGTRSTLGTATLWAHAQGSATATLPAERDSNATGEISVHIVFTDSVSSPADFPVVSTFDAGPTDAGPTDAGNDAGPVDGGSDAGADGGTDGGGGGGGGGCTLTYTGARQLTSPCTVAASNVNQNSVSTSSVTILSSDTATGANAAGLSQGGASFSYKADFATGTLTAATTVPAGLNALASLQYNDQSDWFQSLTSGGSAAGTFSWSITAVGTPTAQGFGITTYAGTHGSFTGTLPSLSQPDGGVEGDVTLTISF